VIAPANIQELGNGDRRAAIPFRRTWCVDFEFRQPPGEQPWPVCMVARELVTGEVIRMWRGELVASHGAPFDIGDGSVMAAYGAQADLGCFLALGWPLPANVIDVFAEHRVMTNGLILPCGNGLLGALACRGLAHIDAGEKETMRRLVVENDHWTEQQQRDLTKYCESDVDGLIALMLAMAPVIDWPRALLRGRFSGAVARQQHVGVPIDAPLHERLVANWGPLKQHLVREVDAEFGVYDGTTFKVARFAAWLAANGINWPRLPSGRLALDDRTFKEMALRFQRVGPLRELRNTMGKLRLTGLTVGADGRNRAQIWPFSAKTGRNQPSNTESIFGPAKWMRGEIRPPPGYGVAYIDWHAQELGIAAALSGDERMLEAYNSGDPYLAFAMMAALVPAEATATGHPIARERAKQVMLAANNGTGERSLAGRLGLTQIEASELLRLHRLNFPRFWQWIDHGLARAMLTGEMQTVFGWRLQVGREPNPRSLTNFPMQANGAEMMRVAAIAAAEAGVEVCAPVHDAFLIAAPLDRLDEDVARMREIMTRAGNAVTGGLDVRTEAKVVRWPGRYMADGGQEMWDRVMRLLDEVERAP